MQLFKTKLIYWNTDATLIRVSESADPDPQSTFRVVFHYSTDVYMCYHAQYTQLSTNFCKCGVNMYFKHRFYKFVAQKDPLISTTFWGVFPQKLWFQGFPNEWYRSKFAFTMVKRFLKNVQPNFLAHFFLIYRIKCKTFIR